MDLAIIAGVLLALGCVGLAAAHSWTVRRMTLVDWSVLAIGGVYGIGWVLVVFHTRSGRNPVWEGWLLPNKGYFLLHTACVLVLVTGLVVGWLAAASRNSSAAKTTHGDLDLGAHSVELTAAWLMLSTAVFTQWIYCQAYGGFIGALAYSAAVRSGIFAVENSWSFLFPFGSLALVSSFIFFGLLLSGPRRAWLCVSLVLSVLCSMYVLLSHLGRMETLVYFATFVFGYLSFRVRSPLVLLSISGLGAVATLIGAYWLSFATGIKFTEGLGSFLATELAFPFVSFFGHLSADTTLRWFYDILAMPAFILPTSLWIEWIEEVSHVNTVLILGAPKGLAGVTGGIPVDLLTLGMLQASVPGVFVVGLLFGVLLHALDRLMQNIQHFGVRSVVASHLAFQVAVLGVFYAQPALLVKGNMYLVAAALIFVVARFLVMPTTRPVSAVQ